MPSAETMRRPNQDCTNNTDELPECIKKKPHRIIVSQWKQKLRQMNCKQILNKVSSIWGFITKDNYFQDENNFT